MGKCGLKGYDNLAENVLSSKQLLAKDPEMLCFLLSQWGIYCTRPKETAIQALEGLKAAKCAISERIANQLMQLYVRIEDPKALQFFRHVVDDLHLFKPIWCDQIVLWADRCRYSLSHDAQAYIAAKLKLKGIQGPSSSAAEGIRPQLALLFHDVEFGRRPDSPEPKILDPRVHWLRRPAYASKPLKVPREKCRVVGVPLVGARQLPSSGEHDKASLPRDDAMLVYMLRLLRAEQEMRRCMSSFPAP